MLTSVGWSRLRILWLQISTCPGPPSVRDDTCVQPGLSNSCSHTWNICICGGKRQINMCPCNRVRGGFVYSVSTVSALQVTQTSLSRCLFVSLPRRVLLFDIDPRQTASAAGIEQAGILDGQHNTVHQNPSHRHPDLSQPLLTLAG